MATNVKSTFSLSACFVLSVHSFAMEPTMYSPWCPATSRVLLAEVALELVVRSEQADRSRSRFVLQHLAVEDPNRQAGADLGNHRARGLVEFDVGSRNRADTSPTVVERGHEILVRAVAADVDELTSDKPEGREVHRAADAHKAR
jgi:hypothetical protein